jgi:hypothetical protein
MSAPTDKAAAEAAAKRAVSALDTCVQTILSIETGLREQMPEVMAALDEARAELPGLQDVAKKALAALGAGTHLLRGHAILVKGAASKTTVDTEGLVERATQAGEIDLLIKIGVLKYEVVPHQIARLQALQRARYEGYVTTTAGTSAVVLPSELK